MHVIRACNVNDAFTEGYAYLTSNGEEQGSRAGKVLVAPEPVITTYMNPMQRVLFHHVRDANPVFHLFESLYFLAGRNDAIWLDQFVHDFSARFAEADGHQHGSYGYRWRRHFDLEGGGEWPLDQLDAIVTMLKANPDDRQVVLTMWDPMADLGTKVKDKPCNTHAYLRIRSTQDGGVSRHPMLLDLTVCCRSNDLWWGWAGANPVHFSVLLEYLAARIGCGVGRYIVLSNNFHIYDNILANLKEPVEWEFDPYVSGDVTATPIVTHPEVFDAELRYFLAGNEERYQNEFFSDIAKPLWVAYSLWRDKKRNAALAVLKHLPEKCDWRVATEQWFTRRMIRLKAEAENA